MGFVLKLVAYDKEDLEDCGQEDDEPVAEFFNGDIDLAIEDRGVALFRDGQHIAEMLKQVFLEQNPELEVDVELGADGCEEGYEFTREQLEQVLERLSGGAESVDDVEDAAHVNELTTFINEVVDWDAHRVFAIS